MRVERGRNPVVGKSTENLAKLMATENITVEFQKISTPAFDLSTRTLYLPLWKDISKETYNMLVAHEVSHAMYTPTEEWNESTVVSERRQLAVNVVEDSRIEKLIIKKYPGCRSDFIMAYKELHGRDFFDLSKYGVDDREIIDRINLYYKSYGNLYVPFSEDEKIWINRIDNISSFAEALEIADELINYEDSKKEDNPVANDSNDSAFSDDSEELDSSDNGSESKGSESESGDNDAGSADDDYSESDDNESESFEKGENDEEIDDENFESGTSTFGYSNEKDSTDGNDDNSADDTESKAVKSSMESFEEKLTKISDVKGNYRFVDQYNKTIYLYNPYLEEDFNKVILPMKDFLMYANRHSKNFYMNGYKNRPNWKLIEPSEAYVTIRSENLKTVNNMVKTFEMKKSAALNARTMTSKTGLIDMDRLPFYKLTEDIFLQNEVTPKGKNHAIIMYLDMSGSMGGDRIVSALGQIINMIMFCDKVSIPYRVYGFTEYALQWAGRIDGYPIIEKNEWKLGFNFPNRWGTDGDVNFDKRYTGFHYRDCGLNLIELIRSDASKVDRLSAMEFFASTIINYRHTDHEDYQNSHAYNFTYNLLGTTPLNAALYIAPKLINSYRKEVGAEKVTFFIYTDGDATDPFFNFENQMTLYSTSYVDPVNGYYKVSRSGETMFRLYNVLVDRVKFLTDATIIGMRVGGIRELDKNYYLQMKLHNEIDHEHVDFRSILRKNGFYQSDKSLGYDHFTWATNSFMNVENTTMNDELGVKKNDDDISKRVLTSAFMKSHKKNHQSRVMVEKIMEIVA